MCHTLLYLTLYCYIYSKTYITERGKILAGVAFVLIILILCVSVLFGYHMYLCNENGIKMYANPKYEERISELEKQVKELKEE